MTAPHPISFFSFFSLKKGKENDRAGVPGALLYGGFARCGLLQREDSEVQYKTSEMKVSRHQNTGLCLQMNNVGLEHRWAAFSP